MAAATLGLDRASAGEHLIASADARQWAETVAAVRLYRLNQQAISRCKEEARASRAPRTCSIKVTAAAAAE